MKVYILFWIFLGVDYWGIKSHASAKRCKRIESFHGGDVHYFGERKRGSSAFYGCKDGYHLSPSNVKNSTCTDVFKWDPVPPQCLKMARVEIPENGASKGNKDILLHGESYRLTCNRGYELYSEEFGYLDRRLVQITNKNGTLEPKAPKCEEMRCNPADQDKAIVKYTNGSSVTSKIRSRTKVRLECEKGYDYYRNEQPMKTPLNRRCVKGNIQSAPVCKEARCLVSGFQRNKDTYLREYRTPYFLAEGHFIAAKNELEVECTNEDDFELFVNSTASYLESFTTKCRKGRFDVEADEFPICIEKRCHFKPSQDECYTTNVTEECFRDEFKVPSRTTVTLKCQEGYRLNSSEDGLSEHADYKVQITCTKGSYFKGYQCIPEDRCKLKFHEGSKYHHNGVVIENDGRFQNGTQVDLQCLDGFDTFDEEDNFVNDTSRYLHMTCYQGIWKHMYKCKKRCDTFNVTNGEIINKGENITTDLDVVHGDSIIVRCGGSQDRDFQIKCDNGEWQGYVDCNDERKKIDAVDVSENITQTNMAVTTDVVETTTTKDCLLPSHPKFTYRNENDTNISEGSSIGNGETLTVRCATFDYFDVLTSYDYDDSNIKERTVTCIDGELSRFELDCPDVDPAACMELENGVVKKSFNLYTVSCNEGFSLNHIIPEKLECTCQNGELRSTIGKQIPECIQNNCTLPYDVDDKLSVKDRSRVLHLSPGSTVVSGDYVYFNCSKVFEAIYEPLNRRFKCVKGRWIEDEKDPKWKFGNNGEFPKCRKAICEPNCTNGGVCYRDDNCRCKHLTKGKRCEIVWCDKQCIENNGSCVTPGKCLCPEGRYGPNCKNKLCRLPEDGAKPKVLKTIYNTGDTLKYFECNFGYILSSKDNMTCQDDGSWSNIIKCVKKSCRLPEHSAKPRRPKNVYYIGDTLKDFECDFGYTLSSKDGMRCQEDGSWSNIVECVKNQCSVPEVKNAVLETKTENKRLVKIKFKCDSGHHFDENNSKVFVAVCRFGNWSRSIPARCWPDSCKLKMHEGSKYFFNETLIENAEMFPHSSHVGLQCFDNFDTFDDKNNIVNATSRYPHMTCYRGSWKNIYKCKKRCNLFDITYGNIFNKEGDILADKDVVHGDSIIVRCEGSQDKDFQMKCDNGEWQGNVDCNDERKKINAEYVSENITLADIAGTTETIETTTTHTNGCLLNMDKRFTYRDENNNEISEGSFIGNGTTLTVSCVTFDYYDYLYGVDENNKAEQTITCVNGELSRFDLDCQVDPDACTELQNGVVKKLINWYTVSCNEGFSLNLIKPEKTECTCKNGELRSTFGNQIPKCIQNNCTLPDDIDDKLSVKDKSRVLSLSAGSKVVSGDHVYFNCSKVTEDSYEPSDRRFKCVKGRWIEDEEDPNWALGNNGTFPKCRKAICEPNCTNGGVCYKDDHCRCKHLTKGKRCEIEFCRLPEHSAKPKEPEIRYSIGDTLKDFECDFGYTLSSKDAMTCQEDGSWSNIVHCVKSVFYLISVKTANDGWKVRKGNGTDANVYIYLHGHNGKTNKINLIGNSESNDRNETRVEEKDIRPITSVTIGHDGKGTGLDWPLEFVSIYINKMNEYYVFRLNHPVLITESKDIELPLKDNCVYSFDKGHYWYPHWNELTWYNIGNSSKLSERACQQKCTELTDFQCISVHYLTNQKSCWGFSTDYEGFFNTNRDDKISVVYKRTCRQIE